MMGMLQEAPPADACYLAKPHAGPTFSKIMAAAKTEALIMAMEGQRAEG